jgi:predicted GNAT family N-acyltransferase
LLAGSGLGLLVKQNRSQHTATSNITQTSRVTSQAFELFEYAIHPKHVSLGASSSGQDISKMYKEAGFEVGAHYLKDDQKHLPVAF